MWLKDGRTIKFVVFDLNPSEAWVVPVLLQNQFQLVVLAHCF
jgi:hypothetical protein